jgi:hypothetical protein
MGKLQIDARKDTVAEQALDFIKEVVSPLIGPVKLLTEGFKITV